MLKFESSVNFLLFENNFYFKAPPITDKEYKFATS